MVNYNIVNKISNMKQLKMKQFFICWQNKESGNSQKLHVYYIIRWKLLSTLIFATIRLSVNEFFVVKIEIPYVYIYQ
jgi:hypothetical protein